MEGECCDGQEFAVLSGTVDMHYKAGDEEKVVRLECGDVFFAGVGCEHVAGMSSPLVGEARVLVVEKEGSV